MAGGAGHVALHPHGGDEPDALEITPADLGAEHPGGHHAHVAGRVEPTERQRVSAGHDDHGVGARRQGNRGDDVVGDEDAHDVGVVGPPEVARVEPVGLRRVPARVGPHAHHHVEPRVTQVEGPGPALVAVPDDGHPLAVQYVEMGIVVAQDHCHFPTVPRFGGPRGSVRRGAREIDTPRLRLRPVTVDEAAALYRGGRTGLARES